MLGCLNGLKVRGGERGVREEGEGERIRGRGEEGIAEVEGEGCLESALLAGEKTRWCFNGLYI